MKTLIGVLAFIVSINFASGGEVDVQFVELHKSGGVWYFSVTLKHDDSGWRHYANAWRIVDSSGKILGIRKLLHPHVNEQPFTRTLGEVKIPKNTKIIFVEASDLLHGWSKRRVQIDLSIKKGRNYKIK